MRWRGREESTNVEDLRGRGRGGPPMMLAGGGGLGGLVILLLFAWLTGVNPLQLLQQLPPPGQQAPLEFGEDQGPAGLPPDQDPDAESKAFVSVVLRDTEVVWGRLFDQLGKNYREPKLVLFTNRVDSACGLASAAMGPFYCPGDEKLYLDFAFYRDMRDQLNAPGDFAQAYVIAHEVGHHVQNLLGISEQVHAQRRRLSEAEYNQLSVRLELQADFFAGVWAHHAQQNFRFLEPGDIEEAIQCAAAIGDDRLQKQARGYAVPDSFTHGTSEQRIRWFRRGFETGDLNQGDTFRAKSL